MTAGVRARMAAGAAELLARRGLQATSFSEVLEYTGTPRGSVYHHFPRGKDEMIGAAVELTARHSVELLESMRGAPAADVAEYFVEIWRTLLVRSDFRAGCALAAVTVASESDELLSLTGAAFTEWRDRLADVLQAGGLSAETAAGRAALLLAAVEGAVVISRAQRSLATFDAVAAAVLAGMGEGQAARRR